MSIDAVIRNELEHIITVSSSGRMDQLSDFQCSCGQLFVADDLDRPHYGNPGLPMIHQAVTTLRVLGLPAGEVVLDSRQIQKLAPGTIVEDSDGILLRRREIGAHWFAQDGRRVANTDLSAPVTVLWTPETQERPERHEQGNILSRPITMVDLATRLGVSVEYVHTLIVSLQEIGHLADLQEDDLILTADEAELIETQVGITAAIAEQDWSMIDRFTDARGMARMRHNQCLDYLDDLAYRDMCCRHDAGHDGHCAPAAVRL